MTQEQLQEHAEYAQYLFHGLCPDLKEMDLDETAADVAKAAIIIWQLKDHIKHLEGANS